MLANYLIQHLSERLVIGHHHGAIVVFQGFVHDATTFAHTQAIRRTWFVLETHIIRIVHHPVDPHPSLPDDAFRPRCRPLRSASPYRQRPFRCHHRNCTVSRCQGHRFRCRNTIGTELALNWLHQHANYVNKSHLHSPTIHLPILWL